MGFIEDEPRTVCWFSAGAASAVATKLALASTPGQIVIVYTDPGSEHEDNKRFIDECSTWFNAPIIRLRSDKYADTWAVWEDKRFIVSAFGAPCTGELKKKLRYAFERPTDKQVFGYTAEESQRAERFREQNPGVDLVTPLIDKGLTKSDCLSIVDRAGIALPKMYELGYQNNNCIGCPKGGMGYWNKIRIDFPKTFERMAALEESIGHSVLRSNGAPLFLKDLEPNRGNHNTEPSFECSLLCAIAEQEIT